MYKQLLIVEVPATKMRAMCLTCMPADEYV